LHAHYLSSYGFVGALLDFHPFVVSVWGSDVYQFPQKSALNRWIIRFALGRADGICSTSRAMAREIAKYTGKPIEITPFGVDINRFQPAPDRKKSRQITIGIAKGLKDIYGFPELFRAFARIHAEFPQTRLLIVGDGPERTRYEKMVTELGIRDRVQFVGYVENTRLPQYLNQMDLFVLPSHQESFGVSAIEAQACGVPVIANGIGGLPEVVKDGETGIVLPNNHPDTIYEAIKNLILNEELREKMGTKGVQFVKEHYNWIENANRMIRFYQTWIKDGGR
jgi:L-malate glycosyltransferase